MIFGIFLVLITGSEGANFVRSLRYRRATGENYVEIKDVPYQASILSDGKHHCGASIIQKYWLLSAAHCFDDSDHHDFAVMTGSTYTGDGKLHKIERVIIHADYKASKALNNGNDICLIKVWNAIQFDKNQTSIKITNNPPQPASMLTVSGYGQEYNNGPNSPQLKVIHVSVQKLDTCKRIYTHLHHVRVTENMLCAGNSRDDACYGDSGGPAVFNHELVGIVSMGMPCETYDEPVSGIYTNVYNYRKWISSVTGKYDSLTPLEKDLLDKEGPLIIDSNFMSRVKYKKINYNL